MDEQEQKPFGMTLLRIPSSKTIALSFATLLQYATLRGSDALSIRRHCRFSATMLSLNTLTKMAKALKVTLAELVE